MLNRTAHPIKEEVFKLELLMSITERRLASDLRESPNDQSTINAYVDYLKEQGRDDSAELIAKGYVPGCNVFDNPQGSSYTRNLFSGSIAVG